jgi:transcription antitermination factor NusG
MRAPTETRIPPWVVLATPHPSREWRRGQLVRIGRGPMAGRFGLVARMQGRHHVRVLVDLFNGETPAVIDVEDLA